MSASASLSFADDCMHLAGEIDFANVVTLEKQGTDWLRHQAPAHCRVNLSAVVLSNSAGTALLISLLRTAADAGKNLAVEQVPGNLAALLNLGGVDELLPAFEIV